MHCYKKSAELSKKADYLYEDSSFYCKQKYIKLFEELPIGVLLTNKRQEIEYCNPVFSTILGFKIADIYNYDIKSIFNCSSQDKNDAYQTTDPSDDFSAQVFTCNWNTKLGIQKKIRCKKIDIDITEDSFSGIAWYIEDLSFSLGTKETFCQTTSDKESKIIIQKKLEIESAISYISSTLIAPDDLDSALVNSLEITGEICGASRAYFFHFHDGNKSMSNTHEWCSAGVKSQKDTLQDLPVTMFPWWMDKISRGEIIHVKNVSSMPPEAATEKEILEMQDITSLLVLPVYISGIIAGFIGLDNVAVASKWTMKDVMILGTVANIIGSAIGQREIQDELNEHNRKLEQAYNELKNIEIMKDEFISNLSHELRTPLSTIQGYSELLVQNEIGPLNPKQKKVANAVFNSSKKLSLLINSLLYMGSVLAGKVDYQFDPVQIENVIDNTVLHFAYEAQKKKIHMKKEINGKMPVICGDVNFLLQLFYKLLDNAIKFTPEGGNITIASNEENSGLHLEVRDTGIGIPQGKIDDIFTSFYQVDGSSTRRYGGTGLGLYASKKIVDAHYGKIWIDKNGDKGTIVHVFLPANRQMNVF